MTASVTLIVAVANDGVIGHEGKLPWHLPEDLRRFRALTLGHSVLMGRKTWDSLPPTFRPLPGRDNIVLSHQTGFVAPGARVAPDFATALAWVRQPPVFVIGGATLYAQALPHATCIEMTHIDADVPGDAFFPQLDPAQWETVTQPMQTAADGLRYQFLTHYRRCS